MSSSIFINMDDRWVLTGSRPPSSRSQRPPSSRLQRPSSSKSPSYKTISKTSDTDDILFGRPDLFACDWDEPAPWETVSDRKSRRNQPLIWAPAAKREDVPRLYTSPRFKGRTKPQKMFQPSFVDETLFGSELDDASFPAPWEVRGARPFVAHCTTAQEGDECGSYRPWARQAGGHPIWGDSLAVERPPSRQGRRPATARACTSNDTTLRPVWKP